MEWTGKTRMALWGLSSVAFVIIAAVLWYVTPILAAAVIGVAPPTLTILWRDWVSSPDISFQGIQVEKYPLRVWPPPDSGLTEANQQTNRAYVNVRVQNTGSTTLREAILKVTLTRVGEEDSSASSDSYEARWTTYMNPIRRELHPGDEATATVWTVELGNLQLGRPIPPFPGENQQRLQWNIGPGEWPPKPLSGGEWKLEVEVIGEDFRSSRELLGSYDLPDWILESADWAESVARRIDQGYLIEWIEAGDRYFVPDGSDLEDRIRDAIEAGKLPD